MCNLYPEEVVLPKTHLGSTPMTVIYSLGLRANKNTGCTLGGTSMSTVEPPLFFFFFFFK